MKAIILAAGKCKRLKGTVDNIPKPMIRIKGEPILEHNVEWLKRFGIKEIYINLHHFPDAIKNYFGDGKKMGVKIRYSYEPKLLGTAGGVRRIIDKYWNSEDTDTFLVIYGDNFLDFNLNKIIISIKLKKE
jgi:NDP-sugar pyrophosphorylase family protein